MNMKTNFKTYYTILLTTVCCILSGCDNYLNREPLSDLSPETFFKTKGDMRTWVAGAYDELQNALLGDQPAALEWGDLRSDNYGNTGYGDTRVYMNAIDASQAQYNWENLYRVIDRCNVAIKEFPTIPNVLPSDYNDYLGQCYGLRALMYFYAIRVWGDVPLIIEPWEGDIASSRVARTPVAEIKAQILSDIGKAIETLTPDVVAGRKYYFNRAAAWALKTDLHMWFKEYDQALAASSYFINNANYALVTNVDQWKSMFTDPTGAAAAENIFTMAWAQDLTDGTNQWAQRVGASNTNNTYQVSRNIFNEFIARHTSGKGKDGRFWCVLDTVKLSIAGGTNPDAKPKPIWIPLGYNHYGANGTAKNTKFSQLSTVKNERWVVISTTTSFVQLPIYRLADVLLLRAEALNKLGDGTGALAIVNNIRNRVGYKADANTEVNVGDKVAVENIILKERQLEFMGEGKRWFDLIRTDKVIEVMDPVMRQRQLDYHVEVSGFGDPGRAKAPIYYKEFEANPLLDGNQNPPYTQG
jgi:hypothetical protein